MKRRTLGPTRKEIKNHIFKQLKGVPCVKVIFNNKGFRVEFGDPKDVTPMNLVFVKNQVSEYINPEGVSFNPNAFNEWKINFQEQCNHIWRWYPFTPAFFSTCARCGDTVNDCEVLNERWRQLEKLVKDHG